MRPVHARRSGMPPLGSDMPPRGALPAVGRALVRALAVVTLIAGIVAMHSLGLGHGSMATGDSAQPVMAGLTEMVGMGASPAAHVTTTAPERVAAGVAEVVAAGVAEVSDPVHGMASMCLAVVPLLVLLLARLLGWRVGSPGHAVRLQGGRGFAGGNRAPSALLCPSLRKLCIQRT